jgi:hypothetical protein
MSVFVLDVPKLSAVSFNGIYFLALGSKMGMQG